MIDPYLPPKTEGNEGEIIEDSTLEIKRAAKGCAIGGCLIPILLLIICVIFLGDIEGILIYPLIGFPMGLIGMAIGALTKSKKG